jgi:hypothetical protein
MPLVNGALLLAVAASIVFVEAADRKDAAVEAGVRRYAAAVSSADLDSAMAEIAPNERAAWSDWVAGQLGNVYDVRGIAVHAAWLLGAPTDVTVVMDVNRGDPEEFYQPTTTVPVEDYEGHPYLAAPLLGG